MKKFLLSLALLLSTGAAQAAGVHCGVYSEPDPSNPEKMVEHHYECSKANVDITDKASLQRGAAAFMSYCVGCHSAKYLRYERMATDLAIPPELVQKYMMFTTDKIGDHINPKIDAKMQKQWFGNTPPDLTLETRLRSPDWVYSYLLSFYPDDKRPWGVNNTVFKDVAMPHVLFSMQQELGDEEYEARVYDLVNFMNYMAEPVQHDRKIYGIFVILFLLVLLIPVYLLNKEYWKDVK
jgi:ubiquinol-cytochrome c reductase cytochrome c1 subunit